MSKILNFGSLNIDLVYAVEHIVAPGETISSLKLETYAGGKGLNQSVALARGGGETYHAGGIGEDDGQILRDMLETAGVRLDYLETRPGKSGHAIIQVDEEGQNCIIIHGGSNKKNTSEYIDKVLAHFGEGDWLVLQNEINLNKEIVDKAKARGMKIAYNPSPINKEALNLDLKAIDLFFVNEIEAELLSGQKQIDRQIESLRLTYPEAEFVMTRGGDGAIFFDREALIQQPIFTTDVVDTTAAGDTFCGFYLTAIVRGETPKQALRTASQASSITVSRSGAAPSIPALAEVLEKLKHAKVNES